MSQPFNGTELTRERLSRAMSYREFGIWLAQRYDQEKQPKSPSPAYTRDQVYEWEHSGENIPSKIELIINWSLWDRHKEFIDEKKRSLTFQQEPDKRYTSELIKQRDEEIEALQQYQDSPDLHYGAW